MFWLCSSFLICTSQRTKEISAKTSFELSLVGWVAYAMHCQASIKSHSWEWYLQSLGCESSSSSFTVRFWCHRQWKLQRQCRKGTVEAQSGTMKRYLSCAGAPACVWSHMSLQLNYIIIYIYKLVTLSGKLFPGFPYQQAGHVEPIVEHRLSWLHSLSLSYWMSQFTRMNFPGTKFSLAGNIHDHQAPW